MALDKAAITSWPNANKHVDSSIGDGTHFTSSKYTVVYAKLTDSNNPFVPIGVIQGWSLAEQRQVEEIFELGSDVRYIIPGRTTGQISITRLLVNGADLLNVFYGTYRDDPNSVIRSLKDINQPVDIVFVAYLNDTNTTENLVRYFSNCWLVSRQESVTANSVVIAENCSMLFEKVDSTKVIVEDLS